MASPVDDAALPRRGAAARVKRVLVGAPRHSAEVDHTLLPKFLALPVFTADALSSVAYCVEATMVVLVTAGLSSLGLVVPIQIAIVALMAIVVTSYRQTVRAYPSGGGSYIVTKDNLGTTPGLVAAAALLIDYVLTVSVSVVAGVLAIISAVPGLAAYRIELSIGCIVLIAVANLRGVRESGLLFAFPVYAFILAMFALIGAGMVRCLHGCPAAVNVDAVAPGAGAVTLFLVLYAFSSGASALTGVEAISNGIRAFRRPQSRNAAATLAILGVIAISMILGTTFLAVHMHARPSSSVSVVSEIARGVFPGSSPGSPGPMFYVVQICTLVVLVLAANTSFQDFPRLSAILARDGFMPRQFENLGDRLVFSNGVLVLTVLSSALIVVFDANLDRLIQLYVLGVFTAFTLSQTGMVVHWLRAGRDGSERRWRRRSVVNGVGAACTGLVMIIVAWTKFSHGAWIVMVATPVLVAVFVGIHRHYANVAAALRVTSPVDGADAVAVTHPVLVVPDLGVATMRALGYIRSIAGDGFRAVHVEDRSTDVDPRAQWAWTSRSAVPLEVLRGTDGDRAVLDYVRSMPREPGDFVNVVVPEAFDEATWFASVRGMFSLKLRLLSVPDVAVTNVPVVLSREGPPVDPRPLAPKRHVTLVFAAGVSQPVLRAVAYAKALRAAETRAVFFATEPTDVTSMIDDWFASGVDVPLDLVEAPFRDLGPPMLREIRRYTSQPGTVVTVVLYDLLLGRRRHLLLHNQRALFVKRLLLHEPNVVVTSVPFRLPGDAGSASKPAQVTSRARKTAKAASAAPAP
jgi:amino acid transporter